MLTLRGEVYYNGIYNTVLKLRSRLLQYIAQIYSVLTYTPRVMLYGVHLSLVYPGEDIYKIYKRKTNRYIHVA